MAVCLTLTALLSQGAAAAMKNPGLRINSLCNRSNTYSIAVNASQTTYQSAKIVTFGTLITQVFDSNDWPVRVPGESVNLTRIIPHDSGLVVLGAQQKDKQQGLRDLHGAVGP